MDKKILAIMVTLVVVAALVVAVVMIAAGGFGRAGGFTTLFDKLENNDNDEYNMDLTLPTSWDAGDKMKVTDVIVDMTYDKVVFGSTWVYQTTLYFVYVGEKWHNDTEGTSFNVPVSLAGGIYWLHVRSGAFHLSVSSATDLSAKYDIGDSITLETTIAMNGLGMLSFSDWNVANTL
jgi:hypothetical protein